MGCSAVLRQMFPGGPYFTHQNTAVRLSSRFQYEHEGTVKLPPERKDVSIDGQEKGISQTPLLSAAEGASMGVARLPLG